MTPPIVRFCLPLLAALFFFALASAEVLDRIAAVVNHDVITDLEVTGEIDEVESDLAGRGAAVPSREILRPRVLDALINRRLQLQRADALGIQISEEDINEHIARAAAERGMSASDFQDAIVQNLQVDFADFRRDIRDDLRIQGALRREVFLQIYIPPAEVDDFLRARRDADDEILALHILIAIPEGADVAAVSERRALAEKVRTEAANDGDFAQLAVANSDGESALDGGEIGWRRTDSLPSLFVEELQNLREGEVGRVLEGGNGFHILKLEGRRQGEKSTATARRRVRHILLTGENSRAQAEAAKKRIEDGESFAAVAAEMSADTATASAGGDLGWSLPGQLLDELENAVASLAEGKLSEPVRSDFGWHILQVNGIEAADAETERRRAISALRERRAFDARAQWLRRLRGEAYIELRQAPEF